jgi:hypothetical protein
MVCMVPQDNIDVAFSRLNGGRFVINFHSLDTEQALIVKGFADHALPFHMVQITGVESAHGERGKTVSIYAHKDEIAGLTSYLVQNRIISEEGREFIATELDTTKKVAFEPREEPSVMDEFRQDGSKELSHHDKARIIMPRHRR